MSWHERYGCESKPSLEEIKKYVDSPLWVQLCAHIENVYAVVPSIEYSRCGMEPGWNIKYKKGSKSICTLYAREGFFTCLVVVSSKNSEEFEPILAGCDPDIQTLYQAAKPFNGARWLMIDVTTPKLLQDVQRLLAIRVKPAKKRA